MAAFETVIPVRFQHCDPAGIVFYPRYFEMINQTVEEWFAAMDRAFPDMHMADRKGVPVVSIDIRFTAPSDLGDPLTFRLSVADIGGSSFTIALEAVCGGELRLKATMVLAYMDLDSRRPVRLPEDLKARMTDYSVPAAAQ